MKKHMYFITIICFLFISVNSNAQNFYMGIDYVNINFSEQGIYKANLKAVRYKMGYLATPNISFEGQFALGTEDDTINILGTNVNIEIDSAYGLYILGILPLKEKARIYATIGYIEGIATINIPSMNISDKLIESDLSYGFGGELIFNEHLSGTMEYIQFIDKPNIDYSGLSMGIKIYF